MLYVIPVLLLLKAMSISNSEIRYCNAHLLYQSTLFASTTAYHPRLFSKTDVRLGFLGFALPSMQHLCQHKTRGRLCDKPSPGNTRKSNSHPKLRNARLDTACLIENLHGIFRWRVVCLFCMFYVFYFNSIEQLRILSWIVPWVHHRVLNPTISLDNLNSEAFGDDVGHVCYGLLVCEIQVYPSGG